MVVHFPQTGHIQSFVKDSFYVVSSNDGRGAWAAGWNPSHRPLGIPAAALLGKGLIAGKPCRRGSLDQLLPGRSKKRLSVGCAMALSRTVLSTITRFYHGHPSRYGD